MFAATFFECAMLFDFARFTQKQQFLNTKLIWSELQRFNLAGHASGNSVMYGGLQVASKNKQDHGMYSFHTDSPAIKMLL